MAAALAYFKTSLADKTRILIYDLGGGTCDVAIVEANSSVIEKYTVIDSDMKRVGGKDWDSRLEDYIRGEVEKQSGLSMSDNPSFKEKIKRAAISAKHSFSEKVGESYRDRVRARVEVNGKSYNVPITKELFDKLTMSLLDQTLTLANELLIKNDKNSVDKIVCVGGGSNMPQVMEGLKRTFPGKDIQIYEPDKAIAIGAGIYAQFCDGKDTFLSDIASFSYGTNCYAAPDRDEEIIVNLIKRGDRLPSSCEHSFSIRNESDKMYFRIYESKIASANYPFEQADKPFMTVILKFGEKKQAGYAATLHMTLTPDGIMEIRADDRNGHTVNVTKQLHFS